MDRPDDDSVPKCTKKENTTVAMGGKITLERFAGKAKDGEMDMELGEDARVDGRKIKKIKLRKRDKYAKDYARRDITEYRKGYPEQRDVKTMRKNLQFYNNKIQSSPNGAYIDTMLEEWHGDYKRLEQHHGYIQWLFPIRERGMNWEAQELQKFEAEAIKRDPNTHGRVLKAYKMMLHFYGMKLIDETETTDGRIERHDNWELRFQNLNRSTHNYLRITRILKSLGELGFEDLKMPFVKFILHEALIEQTLDNTIDSCLHFWLETIKNKEHRQILKQFVKKYVEE
ncbi:unnamed protein product [Owenia fusiformis]|nr:unnamed protein product [Owenia fusiformis]